MTLEGRKVLVVGATGTIGGAIAEDLLLHGALVLATGRSEEALRHLAGRGAATTPLDLANPDGASVLAHACEEMFGPVLDGLVLAAGAHGPIGPSRDLTFRQMSAYLNEQLVAVVALIAALAPALDRSSGPSVVMLSGGGATGPRARYTPYALAKVALVRFAENLAVEEPSWKVNAVAPGFIASRIHESSIAAGEAASGEDPASLRARLAAADDPGRAAGLVRFLVSNASAGISGRLVSAVWDPWDDQQWQDQMRSHPSLGRLRRIDGDQFGPMQQQP